MKRFITVIALILLIGSMHAQEVSLRVPNVVWNSASFAPFLWPFPENSIHYQQVYDSSEFLSEISQGAWLTKIEFLLDGSSGPFFGTTLSDVQINASTTLSEADGLSVVFEENVGRDETVIFGRGPLILPNDTQPQTILLETSFYYNPNLGNLLIDVWNYEGYVPDPFSRPAHAAHDELGDSVSAIYAVSADDSTGFAVSVGVVTRFTFEPVPEPSTVCLAVLGCAFYSFCRLRQLRRKESTHVLD